LLIAMLLGCHGSQAPPLRDPEAQLHFVRTDADGSHDTPLAKRTLAERCELVVGFDPYYKREKRFWAVPLAPILVRAFAGVDVATAQLVLRAKDGYAVPIAGSRLLDGGAYLALADADLDGAAVPWEPVGPQRADPTPYYLIWKRKGGKGDLERYPQPWSLEQIEVMAGGAMYPHTEPPPDPAARRGHALFLRDCVRCHAMNREGGHVGPDLNVPRSIVEYRPREQIRAYIHDPMQFRYGTMPAHPHLTEHDLDDLCAYFDVMKDHKHDPDAAN
jgi:mono/diheme cytochrome c family protein